MADGAHSSKAACDGVSVVNCSVHCRTAGE